MNKTKYFLGSFLALSLVGTPFVSIHAATTPANNLTQEQKETITAAAEASGKTYTDLQTKMVTRINTAIDRVTTAIGKINGNQYLTATTKATLVNGSDSTKVGGLNAVLAQLNKYLAEVQKSTSLVELEALNAQVASYLVTNKDSIKAAMKASASVIAKEASATMDKIMSNLEATVDTLQISCPNQKTQIDAAQKNVDSLQALADTLKKEIASDDMTAAKTTIKKMAALTQDTLLLTRTITDACYTTENETL